MCRCGRSARTTVTDGRRHGSCADSNGKSGAAWSAPSRPRERWPGRKPQQAPSSWGGWSAGRAPRPAPAGRPVVAGRGEPVGDRPARPAVRRPRVGRGRWWRHSPASCRPAGSEDAEQRVETGAHPSQQHGSLGEQLGQRSPWPSPGRRRPARASPATAAAGRPARLPTPRKCDHGRATPAQPLGRDPQRAGRRPPRGPPAARASGRSVATVHGRPRQSQRPHALRQRSAAAALAGSARPPVDASGRKTRIGPT